MVSYFLLLAFLVLIPSSFLLKKFTKLTYKGTDCSCQKCKLWDCKEVLKLQWVALELQIPHFSLTLVSTINKCNVSASIEKLIILSELTTVSIHFYPSADSRKSEKEWKILAVCKCYQHHNIIYPHLSSPKHLCSKHHCKQFQQN